MHEILIVPFESEVSISFGALEIKPHWNSKPNALGDHLPGARPLVWGA